MGSVNGRQGESSEMSADAPIVYVFISKRLKFGMEDAL